MTAYKVSLRELRFFLWELNDVERRFLSAAPYSGRDRAYYDTLLERARDFALELGKSYRSSDIEGCTLGANGEVAIPSDFHALWTRFRAEWVAVFGNKRAAAGEQASDGNAAHANIDVPPILTQVILEMFMGANPSFMTYGGFTRPATKLLQMHGTPAQKRFVDRLSTYEWDACFCATEPQAGSDLTAVTTSAAPIGGDVYAVTGEKIYISAGMHELTGNTLYFVLARVDTATPDSFSLSCLVVPRFWENETTGELEPNHVECIGLPRKMGLKGCANTHLVFGRSGVTRAYLLGNRKNVGLLQLVPLMNQARMSTGMFGVGVASSAYLHSVAYARRRFQGRPIEAASDTSAPRVRIIEHADVQRMLLDMKVRVEGCRGLLGKLASAATQAAILEAAPGADTTAIERNRKLQQLLTPICKAFISDQAWRICETAIQVHGGIGYTDASPVEQNARDVKILSIWEGANYIQAQDLVRDKLGFGRNSVLMRYFREELDACLDRQAANAHDSFDRWFVALRAAADALERGLERIAQTVQGGEMRASSQFYTRFLEMFGLVGSGWVLLESACIADRRLREDDVKSDLAESAFYRGKIKSAAYFFENVLPLVEHQADVLDRMSSAACMATPEELAEAE
ncbi:acyl-CoA dehydrogenase [Trinickia sp. EG282A]|uniref:acyl-CoA dehydrogenase n=1 Tax=Trinickia sp. EG282A TaxID=3237013 RepID=UPI0034D25200